MCHLNLTNNTALLIQAPMNDTQQFLTKTQHSARKEQSHLIKNTFIVPTDAHNYKIIGM
jgi:hypothetical protein